MLDIHANDAERSGFLLAEEGGDHGQAVSLTGVSGLEVEQVTSLDLIVISKQRGGWTALQVAWLRRLVLDIAAGTAGPCKFLVFDLASDGATDAEAPAGFDALIDEIGNLIFEVPVISITWARRYIAGPDLELALACSMLVGEAGTRFSFEVDLVSALRSYSLLAHKIGFVRAERLMEGGAVLDAAAVYDLMLLHSVVPASEGMEGLRQFVGGRRRRHNSACGIYRAQRIAMMGA